MTPPEDRRELQRRIEREEFARGHVSEGAEPTRARPAATTVVVRPGPIGPFEILLLERPEATRFAAGAYVFPGGVVDEEDAAPFWAGRAPALPNLDAESTPAAIAAIRELFEETGIFLADGVPGSGGAGPNRAEFEEMRRALLSGARTFEEVARETDATFTRAPMTYFARWITPRRLSRRYDALFFLVTLRDRGESVSITPEHESVVWLTAEAALEGFRSGELPMLFPTWKTIERLGAFERLEEAEHRLGNAPVEPIEPLLDVRGETVTPRLPGEG